MGNKKGFAIYWESEPVCRESWALLHTAVTGIGGIFFVFVEAIGTVVKFRHYESIGRLSL